MKTLFCAVIFAFICLGSSVADETTISATDKTVGQKVDVNADDQAVNDLLKSNIAHLSSGDGSKLEVVSIKKITKQVVAGMKYEITGTFKKADKTIDCVVTMWYRSWVDEAEKVKLKAECGSEKFSTKGDEEW